MVGDLRLHLDMYFAAGVVSPPEAEAAAWLAGRLGTLVAYQSVPSWPSAYWLAGPDGQRTRARLDSDEYDEHERVICRVDAVEAPVPLLPAVRVAAIPEVIREYRMPTPLSGALDAVMRPEPKTGSAAWYAANRLGAWEGMVSRLTAGWHPDGWYPAGHYRGDLEIRDALVSAADVLPEVFRAQFTAALDTIDRRFLDATVDDGGEALAAATGTVPDRWWWRRITHPLPWHGMPDGR
ncbi:hypothetical protein [Actinoplanes xinjiangensis]|nr:hypothetical protein [Actinoplanes xinjiangensis]